MVTICTTSLTFNNSTFCPHSVFMCSVCISEQTAIISLYSINWLVCITTHIHSVSHAVQNNSVIIIQVYLAQSAICVPPIAEASVQSQTSPCEICGRQTGTGSGHSPSTALSPLIILPALHTYLHLLAVLAKTNGCSLTTFYTTMLFQKSGSTR